MSEPRITYTARPDITPEVESSALAAVYKLCLEKSHANKRGRLLDKSGPNNPERRSDEIRANRSIP